jgi:hypothetical protein
MENLICENLRNLRTKFVQGLISGKVGLLKPVPEEFRLLGLRRAQNPF